MLNSKSRTQTRALSIPFLAAAILVSSCVQVKALTRRQTNALEDACTASSGEAPSLLTKQVSGRPGATVNLSLAGDVAHQKIRFRDANGIAFDGKPSLSGNVTLPSRSGQYQVELFDVCTRRFSYGLATVNDAFTSFVPSPTTTAFTAGFYRAWPDVSHTLADLDGDGKLEYILASGITGGGAVSNPGIHVFEFNGVTNAYVFDRTIANAGSAFGVRAADFDADGNLDLVWFANAVQKIRIAYGDGTGAFAAPVDIAQAAPVAAGVQYGYDIEIADLDRDGRLDFAYSGGVLNGGVTWTGTLHWFLNQGARAFTSQVLETAPGYPIYSVQIADANDDGRLDLFMYGRNPNPRLYRFLQGADGGYSDDVLGGDYLESLPIGGSQPYEALRVGYLNGDSKPDAVSMRVNGPSTVFLSNASDDTLAAGTIPTFTDQHGARPIVADLDTDGENELYMPLKNRALFANKAGIMRKTASTLTAAASPNAGNTILGAFTVGGWSNCSVTMGDIDADGKIDLVMPIGEISRLEVIRGQ